VFDSVSVVTTFKGTGEGRRHLLLDLGSDPRASRAVKKYLGSVVPITDNFYATLNSAVFSDGSFVYVPKGVRCPMELSTYFRINEKNTGQFERTLIIAEKGAYVSYLEGCTAPMRDENQLHAAVVELIALDDAEIKYSTVQNWYPGDKEGKGGIYNFVTKRGDCRGDRSKISWTQVETGSAITWKYPSCILRGDDSSGEFYSIAVSNGYQQVDSGTKMIHLGKNTNSRIISKGIAAGHSNNTYRGLVSAHRKATGARNFTNCDSLLIGDKCGAHTVPYIEAKNASALFEHEATTSKISEDQLFYAMQRGLSQEEAVALIVNGFVKDVLQQLPMEFAVEAQKLIGDLAASKGASGEDLLDLEPDERAAAGVFLAFQYPIEIPGVATMTFLKAALNAQRKARGLDELSTPDFIRRCRRSRRSSGDAGDAEAVRSTSASPAARRSATRSCRWRSSSRRFA
jgi:Fe-S cluster assembly protein SufB